MAGSHITIDDKDVRAALTDLLATVKRPNRAMMDIGEALLRSTDERFRREVSPDGRPWAQNSDVTLRRYLQRRGGLSKRTGGLTQKGAKLLGIKLILRQSGALQDTIRYQVTSDGQGVEVGSNRIYAAVQQFGAKQGQFGRVVSSSIKRRQQYGAKDYRRYSGSVTGFPIPWGDIPARPFLGVSSEDRSDILSILSRHLTKAL